MTVHTLTNIIRYIGLSTDKKPTTPVFHGSEFYEIDTGQNFIWYDGNWVEDIRIAKAIDDALN